MYLTFVIFAFRMSILTCMGFNHSMSRACYCNNLLIAFHYRSTVVVFFSSKKRKKSNSVDEYYCTIPDLKIFIDYEIHFNFLCQ